MALYWAFCTTSYHEGRKRADFNSNSNQKRDLILRTMRDSRDDDGLPARDWAAIDRTLLDEEITQDIQKKVYNVVAKADKKEADVRKAEAKAAAHRSSLSSADRQPSFQPPTDSQLRPAPTFAEEVVNSTRATHSRSVHWRSGLAQVVGTFEPKYMDERALNSLVARLRVYTTKATRPIHFAPRVISVLKKLLP